jgi:hypothetical protein
MYKLLYSKDFPFYILVFCVGLSCTVSVLLLTKLKNERVEYQRQSRELLESSVLSVGDYLPNAPLYDFDNNEYHGLLGLGADIFVVQFVSANCAASGIQVREWWPAIDNDERLQGLPRLLIYQNNLDAVRNKFQFGRPPGRILLNGDKAFIRSTRSISVPLTAVSDRDGKVLWTHRGIMDENSIEDFFRLMNIEGVL